MGIFQTIWNALITENQTAMTIISIPCIFIEAYLYMLIFLTILKIDSSTKKEAMYVIIFSIISILNTYFGVMPYNNLINALSIPLLVLLIFKTNILKAILSEIIMYILVLSFSTIIVALYSSILGISSTLASIIPIHRLSISILLYICLYLFYILCKKYKTTLSLIDKFKLKNNSLLLITNFIIGSIAIGFQYFLLFNHIDSMSIILIFSSLFILLLYFAISMFSLIRTNKLEITTQSLEEQKLYNKTLSTLHDNIRGFKHDFNNIVQAIGGYISTNNMDGLKTYYKDLLEDCQINNNLAVLNPELINNPAIYSILADKYYQSEELGIKLDLEVMADLSNLNIKTYELTRILGILLDNALEATSNCHQKLVVVTFRKDLKTNRNLIIIKNTYINKDINIDRIFEKGYTSKKDDKNNKSHGLGLWEVRKYLKKNTNLDLYTTKNDEFFIQQFEIYN